MTSPADATPAPCEVIPFCPICGGRMEVVYDRPTTKVCVCVDCHTGLSIPSTAWDAARLRRQKDKADGPAVAG